MLKSNTSLRSYASVISMSTLEALRLLELEQKVGDLRERVRKLELDSELRNVEVDKVASRILGLGE